MQVLIIPPNQFQQSHKIYVEYPHILYFNTRPVQNINQQNADERLNWYKYWMTNTTVSYYKCKGIGGSDLLLARIFEIDQQTTSWMHSNQHHKQNNAHDVTHEIYPHKITPTGKNLNNTNMHMINEELITDNEYMNLHDIFHVSSDNNTTPLAKAELKPKEIPQEVQETTNSTPILEH